MHDFGPSNPGVGVGGIFDSGAFAGGAAAAGAAGIGRSTGPGGDPFGVPSAGDSPYPAFLHPSGGYENTSGGVGPGGYPAMGAGAGVAAAGGAAGMAGIGRRSSMNQPAMNRMKSQSSAGALSGSNLPPTQESYASHFTPGYPGTSQQDLLNRGTSGGSAGSAEGAPAAGPGFSAGGANFSSAVHDAAFGGQAEQSALPNPFTSKMESDEGHDAEAGEEGEDAYGGYGSEEEEPHPKVLKVSSYSPRRQRTFI